MEERLASRKMFGAEMRRFVQFSPHFLTWLCIKAMVADMWDFDREKGG